MNKYYLIIFFSFLLSSLKCQVNSFGIFNRFCFGGSSNDFDNSNAIQTNDGGYIFSASTYSQEFSSIGYHGGSDIWLVKLNSFGIVEWERCYGGSGDDMNKQIFQTSDNGYIILGKTYSTDGDFPITNGCKIFLLKLSSNGTIQWHKTYGGSDLNPHANSVQQTTDGGFIFSATTSSNDGDVIGNHGNSDIWIVKTNTSGDISWNKCYGGSSKDAGASVIQTLDGGYAFAGISLSIDGDISQNLGNSDLWFVKLDPNGVISFEKSFGGSQFEGSADFGFYSTPLDQTSNGDFFISTWTSSNDNDVTGNHGVSDIWVLKINSQAQIIWQKSLGGSGEEMIYGNSAIKSTSDSGCILIGISNSVDGDITSNYGGYDGCVFKLNSIGDLTNQVSFGGSDQDCQFGSSVFQNLNGDFVVCSDTYSNDHDINGNHGNIDVWLGFLKACGVGTNSSSTIEVNACQFFTSPSGAIISQSGIYTDVIPNYLGCDSVITMNINIFYPDTVNVTDTICLFPCLINGVQYSNPGVYQQVLNSSFGCDSIVNRTLIDAAELYNVNICIVGIDPSTGKNKLVWEKPQLNEIMEYKIYRESSQAGIFDYLGSTSETDSSVFIDFSADNFARAYTYDLRFLNQCGFEFRNGQLHTTMHLTINQGVGNSWNLIWTPYSGVPFQSYNIYKGVSSNALSLLTSVSSNVTSYTDFNAPPGYVYYQIEIVGPNCNPSKSSYNTSRSNISTNDSSLDLAKIENTKFSIYPNPANNFIHIDYDGNIEKLEIIDAKGTVVFVSKENKKEYALPTHLQTGYYLVKIYSENQIPSRKELFIQR